MAVFDVVIYGATMAGIVAARKVSELRPTATIAVVEWTGRTGGLVTGGLTASDNNATASHWGLTRRFFQDIGLKYGTPGTSPYWRFEAHVAKEVVAEWLEALPNVSVFLNEPIVSVSKTGGRITSITTSEDTYSAGVFIDCSYEAELAYLAGVTMAYGREARSTYGEGSAGLATDHANEQNAPGTDSIGNLKPNYSYRPLIEIGDADAKTQAVNYRLQGTTDPENIVPWPAPPGYDREDFIPIIGTSASGPEDVLTWVAVGDPASLKFDVNHGDTFGPLAWEWPTASYARRLEIMEEVAYWQMGAIFYRANDANIPSDTRAEWALYGLAADEFADDYFLVPHWPPAMYVRAGRRIVGQYVIDENHVIENRPVPDSINNGGYMLDSHTVQRWHRLDGKTTSEGHSGYSYKQYYPIPLRAIKPHPGQADNLLVPLAFSCSNMGWCSARMEPTEMQNAEGAGIVAALALASNIPTNDVSYSAVYPHLAAAGAIIRYEP